MEGSQEMIGWSWDLTYVLLNLGWLLKVWHILGFWLGSRIDLHLNSTWRSYGKGGTLVSVHRLSTGTSQISIKT